MSGEKAHQPKASPSSESRQSDQRDTDDSLTDQSNAPQLIHRFDDPNSRNLTPRAILQLQRLYGNRFTTQKIAHTTPKNPISTPIHRLFTILKPVKEKSDPVKDMIEALTSNAQWLGEQETTTKVSEKDASTQHKIEEILQNKNLKETIKTMYDNSVDYGKLDLTNEQELLLFYYQVKRALYPTQDSTQDEEDALRQGLQEAERWETYEELAKKKIQQEDSVDDPRLYKRAILGAGASVAYYIESAGDLTDTVLIGALQPWAGQRGKEGVINHPMHMIAPTHEQEDLSEGNGLAPRLGFSERVAKTLEKIPEDNRVEDDIVTVKKVAPPGYYRIETVGNGIFYAQHVIAGLGIGQHRELNDVVNNVTDTSSVTSELGENMKRLMNMDEFQRAVSDKKLSKNDVESIVVIGPNASIDAMTTSLRQQYGRIIWISGKRTPPFLPGTDNEYTKGIYDQTTDKKNKSKEKDEAEQYTTTINDMKITVVKSDYLSSTVGNNEVTVDYGTRPPRTAPKGTKPTVEGSVKAQIAVYGLGPDTSVSDMFKGVQLEPVYDINQRFNGPRMFFPADSVKFTLKHYILGLMGNQSKGDEADQIVEKAAAIIGGIEDLDHSENPLPTLLPSAIGVQAKQGGSDDQSTLEFIGGVAARLVGNTNYAYVSQGYNDLKTSGIIDLGGKLKNLGDLESKEFIGLVEQFQQRLVSHLNHGQEVAQKVETTKVLQPPEDPVELEKEDRQKALWELESELRAITNGLGTVDDVLYQMKPTTEIERKAKKLLHNAWARAVMLHNMLREYYKFREKSLSGPTPDTSAAPHIKAVISTLPQNVLLNDQLTPSRSTVEASQDFMPTNVGDEVNLITSDQTVIAAYIATGYGNIPPTLADYVVEKIIYARRHLEVDHGAPLPRPNDPNSSTSTYNLDDQKSFQSGWESKLTQLAVLLDPSKLNGK
jgi:hypothetical protein